MNVIDKICGKFGLSDPDEDEKLALAEEEERERERSQKRAAEQKEEVKKALAAGVPKATILTYFYPEVTVEKMRSYRK